MKNLSLIWSLLVLTGLACSEGSNGRPPSADVALAASPEVGAPPDRGRLDRAAQVADATLAADGQTQGDRAKAPDQGGVGKEAGSADAGSPPTNDTCGAAYSLAFVGGVASASGNTSAAHDDVNVGNPGCVKSSSNPSLSFSTPGKDLFYVVQLTGGQKYTINLDGASTSPKLVSGALYVLESCVNPKGSCKVGGVAESSVWPVVELTFTPSTTASYWIGVDAVGSQCGAFTLTVK